MSNIGRHSYATLARRAQNSFFRTINCTIILADNNVYAFSLYLSIFAQQADSYCGSGTKCFVMVHKACAFYPALHVAIMHILQIIVTADTVRVRRVLFSCWFQNYYSYSSSYSVCKQSVMAAANE